MILVYTGNGKGKTSACVGQAIRALGQDLRVAFAQFMKKDVQAGEQRLLRQLLGPRFHIGGSGFFRTEADRPRHCEAALATLTWAWTMLPDVNLLVLDEALYALRAGLLTKEDFLGLSGPLDGKGAAGEEEGAALGDIPQGTPGRQTGLLAAARAHNTHLVLSGRDLPDWLREAADLVTSMEEVKHPWQAGIPACKGIEY